MPKCQYGFGDFDHILEVSIVWGTILKKKRKKKKQQKKSEVIQRGHIQEAQPSQGTPEKELRNKQDTTAQLG